MGIPEVVSTIQLLVSTGTLLGMVYAFYKFTSKPEVAQNERITALETWQRQLEVKLQLDKESVERRFKMGSNHFSSIDEGTIVTQNAILAIMDTLLNNGDNKEELKKRRDELYSYLTSKK